ncbi:hypothetical protein MAR_029055, partial [Mya arenaria]
MTLYRKLAHLLNVKLTICTIDSEVVAPEEPIPVLHKLHSVDFFYKDSVDLKSSMCENNFETYFKSLNCKQDECFLIENSTKGQHKMLRKIIDILEEAPVVEDFTMDMKQVVCSQATNERQDGIQQHMLKLLALSFLPPGEIPYWCKKLKNKLLEEGAELVPLQAQLVGEG